MRNRIVKLVEEEALRDRNVIFMTADLGYSVVEGIQTALGDRFINAGVSEANMASMAAGMALAGHRVYIYSIAPFVTLRCLEQIRNDICYQGRNVRIIGIGAGFSYGTLGPSHHSLEDATVLAALPRMSVVCPSGLRELDMVFEAFSDWNDPIYFRIGREVGPDLPAPKFSRTAWAWIVRNGAAATAVCAGAVISKAIEAANVLLREGISLRIVSVPLMHPFPTEIVRQLLCEGPVISVAEAYPDNPLEVGVMRMLLDGASRKPFRGINVAHAFPELVGSHDTLRNRGGASAEAICVAVRDLLGHGR